MSEWSESWDLEHNSNPPGNDNLTLDDAWVIIVEHTDEIAQLQKNYTELLKNIINIQFGIASIEKRIPAIATVQASAQISELKDSIEDNAVDILGNIG